MFFLVILIHVDCSHVVTCVLSFMLLLYMLNGFVMW